MLPRRREREREYERKEKNVKYIAYSTQKSDNKNFWRRKCVRRAVCRKMGFNLAEKSKSHFWLGEGREADHFFLGGVLRPKYNPIYHKLEVEYFFIRLLFRKWQYFTRKLRKIVFRVNISPAPHISVVLLCRFFLKTIGFTFG